MSYFPAIPPSPTAYLFVDAGYLEAAITKTLGDFLGKPVLVNWPVVKEAFAARRAFVYQCVDDIPRGSENKTETETRVAAQTAELDKINSLNGYFMRFGSLRGDAKKRRQKEIDVLLAVDMLTHAYSRNMERAVLLAGDLDFKPVVEALVQHGTLVTVASEANRPELARAADEHRKLTLLDLWQLSTGPIDSSCTGLFPASAKPSVLQEREKHGFAGEYKADLYKRKDDFMINVEFGDRPSSFWTHTDLPRLERFVSLMYGDLEWS